MYVAKFVPEAVDDLKRLPKNVRNALKREIEKTVLRDPVGCSMQLNEPLAGFRSFHFGNYRVVYRVFEDLNAIAVVGIGEKDAHHYSDVYKKLENLANTGKLADTVLKTLRFLAPP